MIRVMILDGDPARIAALSDAFGHHEDLHVVATAVKRESAMKQLSLQPDILLVNAALLNKKTLPRFIRSVQSRSGATRVILLHPVLPEDDVLIDQILNGVRGYLTTSDPPALIANAMRSVSEGGIWAERRILVQTISKHTLLPDKLKSHVPDLQPLTCREMDMLNMVLKGATNREIAEMSNISERTVKTHLYRVYRKLNVKSRAKAIALLSHS